jgi:transposase-like protein
MSDMEKCIKCGFNELVKYGRVNRMDGTSSQKWRCKSCRAVRIEEPCYKRMTEADKDLADKLHSEGVGCRKIQRILGFKAMNTILQYLKKKPKT